MNNLAPLMHGQTVHAHASDKPKVDYQEDSVSSAAFQKAMSVQLEANRDHQKKLKNLKEKLRTLREKLHKLKSEYDDDSDGKGMF
jgi:flagellar motility protein MotE (MotC chaperone)